MNKPSSLKVYYYGLIFAHYIGILHLFFEKGISSCSSSSMSSGISIFAVPAIYFTSLIAVLSSSKCSPSVSSDSDYIRFTMLTNWSKYFCVSNQYVLVSLCKSFKIFPRQFSKLQNLKKICEILFINLTVIMNHSLYLNTKELNKNLIITHLYAFRPNITLEVWSNEINWHQTSSVKFLTIFDKTKTE